MNIKRADNNRIEVIGDDGGVTYTQTAEANILLAILEKLDDVEYEIRKLRDDIE